MKRPIIHYLCLAVLFLVAVTYQAWNSWDAVRALSYPTQVAGWPFELKTASPLIAYVREEAAKAGLRKGDVLLAVNGRLYRGLAVLGRWAIPAVRFPDREGPVSRDRRASRRTDPANSSGASRGPFFQSRPVVAYCRGLSGHAYLLSVAGFLGGRRSPARDPLAWLLLALLLSFTQNVDAGLAGWGRWIRDLAAVYHVGLNNSWPIWMLLFGLYFPVRFSFERRLSWLKWVIIIPLALCGIPNVIVSASVS